MLLEALKAQLREAVLSREHVYSRSGIRAVERRICTLQARIALIEEREKRE